MEETDNTGFQLQGQSGGFNDRLNSIFGNLDSKKSNENSSNDDTKTTDELSSPITTPNDKEIQTRNDDRDNERGSRRGKQELHKPGERFSRDRPQFHKPYGRPQRGGRNARVADHVLHPEKYQKYSLKHDGTRDSNLKGDALNKKIALDFIDSLREDKNKDDTIQNVDTGFKPKFRQTGKNNDNVESESKKKPQFQSSHGAKAKVMETFEFGKPSRTKSKPKQTTTEHCSDEPSPSETTESKEKSSGGGISLNYYEDEEENEN